MTPTENEDTGEKYSRRDFFLRILHPQQDSEGVVDDQVEARAILFDNLVEKFGEAAAFFILMATAYDSSRDQLVTYTVDSESKQRDLSDFNEKVKILGEMGQWFSEFNQALGALLSSWKAAYTDSYTTCTPSSDGKGTTCNTDYYINDWHMESQFGIDDDYIGSMQQLCGDITYVIQRCLPSLRENFDLSRGEKSLYYQEKQINLNSGRVEAVMLYGLVGFAFLFYEEILKSAATLGQFERLTQVDEQTGMKRRTFLKVMAALVGGIYLQKFQGALVSENSQLLINIKEHARKVVAEMNVEPEANFERFFGYDLEKMFKMLTEFRNKLQKIIDSGYEGERVLFWNDAEWPAVKTQIINCLEKVNNLIIYLEKTFPNQDGKHQIPKDLTEVTKAIWATQNIQSFVQNQSLRLDLRHFIDAGLLGLFFTGVAVATEKIIIPATNRRDTEEET